MEGCYPSLQLMSDPSIGYKDLEMSQNC